MQRTNTLAPRECDWNFLVQFFQFGLTKLK